MTRPCIFQTKRGWEKVPFLAWIKWNTERRRSICDWFCPALLNAVLLNDSAKISFKFTDKVPFLADLSVIKTHFTDKLVFFGDLSVNFWPSWWGFTDKNRFSEHLSVNPSPKRLNFYGQTAVFDHFVRNRHFWNSPFTDSIPIFIDASVNNSDFAKCSAVRQQLNRCTWPRLRAKRSFWNLLVICDRTAADFL